MDEEQCGYEKFNDEGKEEEEEEHGNRKKKKCGYRETGRSVWKVSAGLPLLLTEYVW